MTEEEKWRLSVTAGLAQVSQQLAGDRESNQRRLGNIEETLRTILVQKSRTVSESRRVSAKWASAIGVGVAVTAVVARGWIRGVR